MRLLYNIKKTNSSTFVSFYAKTINQYIKPKENFWYIIWIKEGRKIKILLPDTVGYKANLHTHTANSDGICTAEEVKRYYRAHGYSILAYTDHLYMRDRSALSDENFVALSGYENCTHDGGGANADKAYHLNFYAPQPDNVGMVGVAERFYNFFNIELTKKSERELEASPVLGGFCDRRIPSKMSTESSHKQGHWDIWLYTIILCGRVMKRKIISA